MRARALALLLVPAALLPAGRGAWADEMAEAPPGAASCLGCHGTARPAALVPVLRGQPPEAVAAALRAFRDGTRRATVMDRLARGFSEAESQAIAAWIVR